MKKKYIDAEKLKDEIRKRSEEQWLIYCRKGYEPAGGAADALENIEVYIDSLQQEQPEKSTKKNCNSCPHCIDRKDQIGWHFRGCFGGQYKGKPIAEIEECPLQEQPDADFEKDLEQEIVSYIEKHFHIRYDETLEVGNDPLTTADFTEIARHFAKWGAIHLNARKEE